MATGIPLANGRAKTARSKVNGSNGHHPSLDITLSYEGKKSESVILATPPAELVRDMLPPGLLQHTFDITIQAPGAAAFDTPAQS
jgi:hypothetical protein